MRNKKNIEVVDWDLIDDIPIEAVLSNKKLNAVRINDLAIDEEYIRGPSDLAYWNAVYTAANEQLAVDEHEYEVYRAQKWLELRETTKSQSPKPTEADLKAMMFQDTEHNRLHLQLTRAKAKVEGLKRFAKSVEVKQTNVQSLGAKLRAEILANPALRDQFNESKKFHDE